jgi:uncharacterized cofD-like protein
MVVKSACKNSEGDEVKTDIRMVVLGGGTGTSTLLNELKHISSNVTAIVNMADDGGSTGLLRDELGVRPPGDIRQCLTGLSGEEEYQDLLEYRFDSGILRGHSFGNILIAALEKTTGNIQDAVKIASELLDIRGNVIPVTLDDVRLEMRWEEQGSKLIGEHTIDDASFEHNPMQAELFLSPQAAANPEALQAIKDADLIVFAPGDLYSSLGPVLAVDGVPEEIRDSKAKKVYVCNLTTKHGQTSNFSVSQHASEIERFARGKILDAVFCNTQSPDEAMLKKYQEANSQLVHVDTDVLQNCHYEVVASDLLGNMKNPTDDATDVRRSYIRHDAKAVAEMLFSYYNQKHE